MLLSNLALMLTFVITGFCICSSSGAAPGSKTCSSNETCSPTEACLNGVCDDPCKTADCCKVVNHEAVCSSKPGSQQGGNTNNQKDLPGGNLCKISESTVSFKKGKFVLTKFNVTWYDAMTMCYECGMHLPLISNQQENDDFMKFLDDAGAERGVWLGAERFEAVYYWINNVNTGFTNMGLSYYYGDASTNGCVSTSAKKQQRVWSAFDCNSETLTACEQ